MKDNKSLWHLPAIAMMGFSTLALFNRQLEWAILFLLWAMIFKGNA